MLPQSATPPRPSPHHQQSTTPHQQSEPSLATLPDPRSLIRDHRSEPTLGAPPLTANPCRPERRSGSNPRSIPPHLRDVRSAESLPISPQQSADPKSSARFAGSVQAVRLSLGPEPTDYRTLSTARRLLSAAHRPLPTAYRPLLTWARPPSTALALGTLPDPRSPICDYRSEPALGAPSLSHPLKAVAPIRLATPRSAITDHRSEHPPAACFHRLPPAAYLRLPRPPSHCSRACRSVGSGESKSRATKRRPRRLPDRFRLQIPDPQIPDSRSPIRDSRSGSAGRPRAPSRGVERQLGASFKYAPTLSPRLILCKTRLPLIFPPCEKRRRTGRPKKWLLPKKRA